MQRGWDKDLSGFQSSWNFTSFQSISQSFAMTHAALPIESCHNGISGHRKRGIVLGINKEDEGRKRCNY